MGIATILRDAIFPGKCAGCGRQGTWLCPKCFNRLKQNLPECYRCRRLSPQYNTHRECISNFYPLNKVTVGWQYDEVTAKLISTFKYTNAYTLTQVFTTIIEKRLDIRQMLKSHKIIIPMPSHPSRVRERGFDHIKLLTKAICTQQNASKIYANIARKQFNNKHQAFISKDKRYSSIRDVFCVDVKRLSEQLLKNRTDKILIIDDVITTGATLNSLAQVMHKSFPTIKIEAFCFFRGKPNFNKLS